MCLGIPGKITETYEKDSLKLAKIDFGRMSKEVCLAYTPEARVREYALKTSIGGTRLVDMLPGEMLPRIC